jgi:hypothetical protein
MLLTIPLKGMVSSSVPSFSEMLVSTACSRSH